MDKWSLICNLKASMQAFRHIFVKTMSWCISILNASSFTIISTHTLINTDHLCKKSWLNPFLILFFSFCRHPTVFSIQFHGDKTHQKKPLKKVLDILYHPCVIESVQDFLIKLDIKLLMHLLEISTFSQKNVIARLTNIINKFRH